MDQPNYLPRSPDTVILITVQKHLSSPRTGYIRLHLLKLPCAALLLDLQRRLRDFIPEESGCVLPSPQYEVRVCLLGVYDRLLDVHVDWCLDRAHEACTHVYAFCAQRDRCGKTLAICKSTARDERDAEALSRAAQQDEVGDVVLAYMPRTLESVDAEEVNAELHGALGVADRGALVQDHCAVLLEHLYDWAGTVAGCLDDADALIYYDLGVLGVWGWVDRGEEGDVYAEGIFSHGLGFADFFAKVFGSWLSEGCQLGGGVSG